MKQISRVTNSSRISSRSGFTLLEVLLVLAILGVIAAMVVPNLLGRQEEAYRKTTRINIAGLENSVKQYAAEHDGQFPEGNAETVFPLLMSPEVDQHTGKQRAPYLENLPLDAWKNPLRYEYPPTGNHTSATGKPAIWSCGVDKQDDTADDINNWSQN
jgi:general secretion pathway protein G